MEANYVRISSMVSSCNYTNIKICGIKDNTTSTFTVPTNCKALVWLVLTIDITHFLKPWTTSLWSLMDRSFVASMLMQMSIHAVALTELQVGSH